jgi:hypothetical protein
MGGYHGGSTKISVSEEGTHWSTDWLKQQVKLELQRRWVNDAVRDDTIDSQARKYRRQMDYRFIAACLEAAEQAALTATNPQPPRKLREAIRRCGGNIKWLFSTHDRMKALDKMLRGFHPDPSDAFPGCWGSA